MLGTVLNVAADAVVGKERKEKAVTEIPTWLVDTFSDKNRLVDTARETVGDADHTPLVKLFAEVLRHFRSILEGASTMVKNAEPGEVEEL